MVMRGDVERPLRPVALNLVDVADKDRLFLLLVCVLCRRLRGQCAGLCLGISFFIAVDRDTGVCLDNGDVFIPVILDDGKIERPRNCHPTA